MTSHLATRKPSAASSESTHPRLDPHDQSLDGRDGSKVRGCNFGRRYHDIELGLHREHEVDHIDGAQTRLGKLLVNRHRSRNRMLRK